MAFHDVPSNLEEARAFSGLRDVALLAVLVEGGLLRLQELRTGLLGVPALPSSILLEVHRHPLTTSAGAECSTYGRFSGPHSRVFRAANGEGTKELKILSRELRSHG